FRLGSLLAFVLAAYALTLPHTPPAKLTSSRLAPLAALRLLRRQDFAVYIASVFGWSITVAFTGQVTPLLLQDLGIPRPWLNPTMTIAQSTEVASLAVLPVLLLRLGLRNTLRLGLSAWVLGLVVLTVGRPVELVVGSLVLYGLNIG